MNPKKRTYVSFGQRSVYIYDDVEEALKSEHCYRVKREAQRSWRSGEICCFGLSYIGDFIP